MKQIVTINLNHICPMVTGVTPAILEGLLSVQDAPV